MKLRNLNGAIRKADKVSIPWTAPNGKTVYINVQKSSLIECLAEAHGNDATAETNFFVTPKGTLLNDGFADEFAYESVIAKDRATGPASAKEQPAAAAEAVEVEDDLDDLLG